MESQEEGGRRGSLPRFIQLWISNLSNSELKSKWHPKGDDHTMCISVPFRLTQKMNEPFLAKCSVFFPHLEIFIILISGQGV